MCRKYREKKETRNYYREDKTKLQNKRIKWVREMEKQKKKKDINN